MKRKRITREEWKDITQYDPEKPVGLGTYVMGKVLNLRNKCAFCGDKIFIFKKSFSILSVCEKCEEEKERK